jgi:hypothetical protein
LVAAAHGQQRCAVLDRLAHRGALLGHKVGRDDGLLAVLPATEEDQIRLVGIQPIAHRHFLDLDRHPAPLCTAHQRQDVAPIAIDVHQVGIQVDQAE